jgi:MFS family permease
VLAAGTAAQASVSVLGIGLPVLAPAIRDEYGLRLEEIGVLLASGWVGTLATLLAWGLLADRVGERPVLVSGLGLCALFVSACAFAPSFAALVGLLALAGAAGASVNSASGRAVMGWFGPAERGFALGVRQTAIPIGGFVAAVVLPRLDVSEAFLFLAALCLVGALVGALVLKGGHAEPAGVEPEAVGWTLSDRRLWLLCGGSGLYLLAQVALIGFVVLFLHDERGLSPGQAGAVLAVAHAFAVALRIGAGRWSDRLGARVVPLRRVGLATAFVLAAAAALLGAPLVLLLPALVAASALSMSWNGLSFTAAAELAGRARSGAAIGFQQSVLSGVGVVAPVVFAATVAAASWRAAFGLFALGPLAGWLALRPLRER